VYKRLGNKEKRTNKEKKSVSAPIQGLRSLVPTPAMHVNAVVVSFPHGELVEPQEMWVLMYF